MFAEILTFELRYRLRRPATYIYFFILFLLAFLAITTDVISIGGQTGNVYRNSPFVIFQTTMILSLVSTMICSAIMGVPIFRDFDHKFNEIYYTTPVRKTPYLLGRFVGSWLVCVGVYTGTLWGLWLGSLMPWVDATTLGPNILVAYLNPIWTMLLPNTLFMGAIFFSVGTLTRNQFAIYVQGILLLVLVILSRTLMGKLENEWLGSLLDPTGMSAARNLMKFWTPAEKNMLTVPFTGALLLNRVLWSAVGVAIFGLCYYKFAFQSQPIRWFGRKPKPAVADAPLNQTFGEIIFAKATPIFTAATNWQHIAAIARFELRGILRSPIFLVLFISGLLNTLLNMLVSSEVFGADVLPVTSIIVERAANSFGLFIFIILVFYTGELVWRERNAKISQITDALPVANYSLLAGKFLAMTGVMAILHVVVMLAAILSQLKAGYFNFEFLVYIKYLFVKELPSWIVWLTMGFFLHTLVGNKFIGHAALIVTFIVLQVLPSVGFSHPLYLFNALPSITLSDMNGFGHFWQSYTLMSVYWALFGGLLLVVAALFWLRGTEDAFVTRSRVARQRWANSRKLPIFALLGLFVLCGSFVFYNTNIIHKHLDKYAARKIPADYERTYKRYTHTPQPRIQSIVCEADIYPENRNFRLKATVGLKNKNQVAVDTMLLTFMAASDFAKLHFEFDKPTSFIKKDTAHGIYLLKLTTPLAVGDSLTFTFDYTVAPKGYLNEDNEILKVMNNGTFIGSEMMPIFGYSTQIEHSDSENRRKEGLPKKPHFPLITDSTQYGNTYISSDSDWITFEATVSTEEGQIAMAPGYLQKDWTKDGRHYFHYKMDSKMLNFFSFLSAKYEVYKAKWNDVPIEIYYHKGHEYNLKHIADGCRAALAYNAAQFGDFQHKQMRILEFPRYATFAQAFPNTVPFSEGIGFILNVDKKDANNTPFYVTAHETGHQWWAHQVIGAPVQGMTVFSESLAEYSALMTCQHEFGKEKMRKLLRRDLEGYLKGRGAETEQEQPLLYNENQPYIHYRKGSLVFYALADYLGEDVLNSGIRNFLTKYKFKSAPYPTAIDFYAEIDAITPADKKQCLIDFFKKITLYSNKCEKATVQKLPNGKYKVTMTVTAQKHYADGKGNETKAALNDEIYVGVLDAEDKLIYQEKRKFVTEKMTVELIVDKMPAKAGIDPINMLIDRDPDDNVKSIVE